MPCSCGRSVTVPSLSTLRTSAGKSAVPLNTLDAIRKILRDGSLPEGVVCPYSGRLANEVIYFHIQCERTWAAGGDREDFLTRFIGFFVFGWVGALIASQRSASSEALGRDVSIEVPVRISGDIRHQLLRTKRQRKLKDLLRQTPIYAKLLQEYPGATVAVMTTIPSRLTTPNDEENPRHFRS